MLPALEGEHIKTLGLTRRQSRGIVAPRKWRQIGLSQRVCPECRAIVPSIQDGFWHLQTAHNQGQGVDLEAWGIDLRAELDEYISATAGRRGRIDGDGSRVRIGFQSQILLAVLVILLVLGIVHGLIG
jgi:hypothetical protein